MDTELVKKLIVPATFVIIVGIVAIDSQLTRRAQLKAMKIVAATEVAEAEINSKNPDTES